MRGLVWLMVLLLGIISTSTAQTEDEVLPALYYYTYHGADGNRFIEGTGTFPNVQTFDLDVHLAPLWMVGTSLHLPEMDFPPTWAVVFEDGGMQGIYQDLDNVMQVSPLLENMLPVGMPPVFTVNEYGAFPDQEYPEDLNILTHSVKTMTRTVYISNNNVIVVLNEDGDEMGRLPLNALPDARIVLNAAKTQAAIYVGATDQRYVNGVLGDNLEGAALIVLNLEDMNIPVIIDLQGDEVFEGLSPMWADVDADDIDELITTVSSSAGGAQVRVYRADTGVLLASGEPVGQPNRWRHQLAWGAFGPTGEMELVEVLTPHIGGVVNFYRYNGADALEIVATATGYTSHVINTRNLDMAIAGDFDGDGQPEIVLPNQERTSISGLAHAAEGIIEAKWSLPLDGVLSSNLAAVTTLDGRLALAAGVDANGAGKVRVWMP